MGTLVEGPKLHEDPVVTGFYNKLTEKGPSNIYNFLIDTLRFADGRSIHAESDSSSVRLGGANLMQSSIDYSNTLDSEKRILLAHGLFQKDAKDGFKLLGNVRKFLEGSQEVSVRGLVQELDSVVESLRPITVLYKIDCEFDTKSLNLDTHKEQHHDYQTHSFDERGSQYPPVIMEQLERISQFKKEDVRKNHFKNLLEQLKMNRTTHTIKFKNKTKTQEWCTKLSGLNVDDYFKKVFEGDDLKGKPDQWIPFSHLIQAEEMDKTESKRQILDDYTPPDQSSTRVTDHEKYTRNYISSWLNIGSADLSQKLREEKQ